MSEREPWESDDEDADPGDDNCLHGVDFSDPCEDCEEDDLMDDAGGGG